MYVTVRRGAARSAGGLLASPSAEGAGERPTDDT